MFSEGDVSRDRHMSSFCPDLFLADNHGGTPCTPRKACGQISSVFLYRACLPGTTREHGGIGAFGSEGPVGVRVNLRVLTLKSPTRHRPSLCFCFHVCRLQHLNCDL